MKKWMYSGLWLGLLGLPVQACGLRVLTEDLPPYQVVQQHQVVAKKLAIWLDQHLAGAPDLSAGQRQLGAQVLCGLAKDLVAQGHADMAAVHDRHSPRTLAQLARDHAQAMKARLEAMLGEPLLPDQPEADLQDVLHAARAHLKQAAEVQDAKAAKRQAKRDAKAKAKQASQKIGQKVFTLFPISIQKERNNKLRN